LQNKKLENSLTVQENWSTYFISENLFDKFEKHLTELYPKVIDAFRGERTGWNPMFVIPANEIKQSGIEKEFFSSLCKKVQLNLTLLNSAAITKNFFFFRLRQATSRIEKRFFRC